MSELSVLIEAILFVAGEPVSLAQLAEAMETDQDEIKEALVELRKNLDSRGLHLAEAHGSYSLATTPAASAAIERFLGAQAKTELSKPALETLAIIAYRQPVTKSQVEEIRGVASDQSLRNLLVRGLIVESGQASEPGRPTLYATSHKFLQLLGIKHAEDLKPLDAVKNDSPENQ